MASSSSQKGRTHLMDEIYDQFLICKICYELYKRPKTLQCLHTFCTECLEKHQDAELERSYRYLMYTRAISCPICRKKTELPAGGVRRLPDNFLVANLGAVITRRLPESKVALCEICKPEIPPSRKQASTRCLDCSKLLCQRCVDLHRKTNVTQQHSLFDIEIEKDIECKVHEGETVRFYCERCDLCICVVCTFQEHKGHEVSSFADGMKKHQRSLDNLVDICKERIDLVKEQLDIIYKCENQIKSAEESIRDMAIETITDIKDKEHQYVKNVHEAYGEETFDFMREKALLQDDLDSLQSTCNLTDIMVKDKGMELLLLKKDIQGKLQNLLQRQVRQPPESAMKQVKFIPGNMVFGYLSVTQPNGEKPADYVMDEGPKAESIPNGLGVIKDIDREVVYPNTVLKHATSQTEEREVTTVGNLFKQICDQLTQTSPVPCQERASSPILIQEQISPVSSGLSSPRIPSRSSSSPRIHSRSSSVEVCERHTMTPCTPTMRRKVQTDSLKSFDEGTETQTRKFTNSRSVDVCESSTLTLNVPKRNSCAYTDTAGLVNVEEVGVVTPQVELSSSSTNTNCVVMYNKSTEMPLTMTRDKLCGTTKILQANRETMTKYIATLDMGVTAAFQGEDKACGTKAIVTIHTACDGTDVRTWDKESETPWKNEYVKMDDHATMPDLEMVDRGMKTEPLSVHHKDTFTSWFNMTDQETETALSTDNASVSVFPSMESKGFNTIPTSTEDKSLTIQTEFLPHQPVLVDGLCQTVISVDTSDGPCRTRCLVLTSSSSCQTSPVQINSHPKMVDKQFGSQSVLYIDQSSSTPPISTYNRSLQYDIQGLTDIPILEAMDTASSDNKLESHNLQQRSDVSDPLCKTMPNKSIYFHDKGILTDKIDNYYDINNISQSNKETSTSVSTCDVGVLKRPHAISRSVSTKRSKLMTTGTETDISLQNDNQSMTNVSYGSKDIYFDDKSIETVPVDMVSSSVGTPHILSNDSSTETRRIVMTDRESSPIVLTQFVERASSPIKICNTVDRSCSPILINCEDKGVLAQAQTRNSFTSTLNVQMKDSSCNYDRPLYVDKQNSPVRNLISTRTKFTSTPHVVYKDRAGSPIPQSVASISTNTRICNYTDRSQSPEKIVFNDQGTLAIADMVSNSCNTHHIKLTDQGTAMKPVRLMNTSTDMPQVTSSEKETSTVHIHVMHKNISTENVQTRDASTVMTSDVASSYRDLIAPPSALLVTRGTCTQQVLLETRHTSPPPKMQHDRASSPVKALTADKAITANKAVMLDTKDTFQSVGKQGRKNLSGSRSKLECIREDATESRSSSDESSTSSKDTLSDFPSLNTSRLSLRLRKLKSYSPFAETRPQMGLGFGDMSHRERFWASSPALGASPRVHSTTMGASMIAHDFKPLHKLHKKMETATNTRDIPTENRSTSTTDIEKMDKAVCTEAVTMQGKMAECISKLKTVRQRLEQQPIYSQASSSIKDSDTQPLNTKPLLSVKSRSIESKLDESDSSPFVSPQLKRRPLMSLSSTSASDSPSESSDQEQQMRYKLQQDKARRMRLNMNQLLRSSSLPESPEPPASAESAPESSPSPQRKLCLPQILPRINPDAPPKTKKTDQARPSSARDRSTREAPPQRRERPKSATERSKASSRAHEKNQMSRSLSQERPPRYEELAKPKPKTFQPKVDTHKSTKSGFGHLPQSPSLVRKTKPRPMARFDEVHPLVPTSPRNTRRLTEAPDAVRARLGETPKQRRERLEKEITFEDRKAMAKQYFQETRPTSPGSKAARPKTRTKPLISEKPPRTPNSSDHSH